MLQEVSKKYQQWNEDNVNLHICFKENENAIKLDLKQQKVDSWEIVPSTAPRVYRLSLIITLNNEITFYRSPKKISMTIRKAE